jgi:hypothetical protein
MGLLISGSQVRSCVPGAPVSIGLCSVRRLRLLRNRWVQLGRRSRPVAKLLPTRPARRGADRSSPVAIGRRELDAKCPGPLGKPCSSWGIRGARAGARFYSLSTRSQVARWGSETAVSLAREGGRKKILEGRRARRDRCFPRLAEQSCARRGPRSRPGIGKDPRRRAAATWPPSQCRLATGPERTLFTRFERPRTKGRRAGRRPVGLAGSVRGLVNTTAARSAA